MSLLAVVSKTEQVLAYLKKEMESQRLKPGDRLLSMRRLAANLATSEQVVRSAYDILEREGILVKEPRRGVFVSKAPSSPRLKEVFILGAGVREGDAYFGEILKITHPPYLASGFSFTTKTFPPDAQLMSVVKTEVDRINAMREIDCVLIHAAALTKNEVQECSRLEKPFVFIGDFSKGEFSDIEFNQVTGDNAFLGKQEVEHHLDKGIKTITLFSGSLEHLFNRQFHSGVEKAAELAGADLHLVEFPKGVSFLTEAEREATYGRIIESAVADGRIGGGVVVSGANNNLIQRLLRRNALEVATKISFLPDCDIDYAVFRDAIIARIDELIVGDAEKKKIRLELPLRFNV